MRDFICLNTNDRQRLLLVAVIFNVPVPVTQPIEPQALKKSVAVLLPLDKGTNDRAFV